MDNDYLVIETPQLFLKTDINTYLTEIVVRGRWNGELGSAVTRALRACLAETPQAVVIDLCDLVDTTGASAATWHTAGEFAASRRPPIDLILCAAPAPVRERMNSRGNGLVRVAGSLSEARARAPWPLPVRRRRMALAPEFRAAAPARAMVTGACRQWGLSRLADAARLIMHELVVNAVEHAATDLVAAVSIRGSALHLAVHDREPALPYVVPHDPAAGSPIEQRGAGLRIVRAAATSWGALPCAVGKVVWACLSLDAGGTVPR